MTRVFVDKLIVSDESGFACSKAKLVAAGLPHLRPFNISEADRLDLSEVYQVPLDEAVRGKTELEAGDILFNNTNSVELVGKSALVSTAMSAGFSNHLTRIRIDKSRIEPAYFSFWLRRLRATGHFTAQATRWVSQAAYKTSELRKLELDLPPLDEQRRIVDILSRAEGIVRLRREAQKKAAELVPAIFLEMFGDPTTNPKGWPVVPLESLMSESPTLGTMAKPTATVQNWLDLRVANIQEGRLSLSDRKWLELSENEARRFSLRDGDVLLARAIGSLDHLGKVVVVHPDGKWTFDSHLMRIRLNRDRLTPYVLKGFLESPGGRTEFLRHTRHSAVQFNINGKEIRKIQIPEYPMSLQRSYFDKLRAIDVISSQQNESESAASTMFATLISRVCSQSCVIG